MADDNFNLIDVKLKIIFVGDTSVGKTTIMNRILNKGISHDHQPTVGVDFRTMCVNVNTQQVKLTLWDTAGQEKFRSIISNYFRNTAGGFVVFDKTNTISFDNLHYWILEVQRSSPDAHLIVIGNKSDSTKNCQITTEDATSFCDKYNIQYVETSFLSTGDVYDCCIDMTRQILDRHRILPSPKTHIDHSICHGFTLIKPGVTVANHLLGAGIDNTEKPRSACTHC
tara:strand:- start:1890 stop:2567 length:678 start_codon:yes stop_codon:yes gene_type:complete